VAGDPRAFRMGYGRRVVRRRRGGTLPRGGNNVKLTDLGCGVGVCWRDGEWRTEHSRDSRCGGSRRSALSEKPNASGLETLVGVSRTVWRNGWTKVRWGRTQLRRAGPIVAVRRLHHALRVLLAGLAAYGTPVQGPLAPAARPIWGRWTNAIACRAYWAPRWFQPRSIPCG